MIDISIITYSSLGLTLDRLLVGKIEYRSVILKIKMTLTLNIPPEIEQHLDRQAREQGLSTEAYALQLLSESISVEKKSTKLVNLLQSWIDEDDTAEQQETGEYLIQALDEDRLSDRKLFPSELKGVTW
jgi:hypothetical protein